VGTLILNQPPGAVCAGAVALVRGSLPQYWLVSVFRSSIFSTGSCRPAGVGTQVVLGRNNGGAGVVSPPARIKHALRW
jgi:hypothetical protein